MQKKSIMALKQLDHQKKEQEEHHGFGTIGLLGSTSKKSITI
jgi:hypothetical protein